MMARNPGRKKLRRKNQGALEDMMKRNSVRKNLFASAGVSVTGSLARGSQRISCTNEIPSLSWIAEMEVMVLEGIEM